MKLKINFKLPKGIKKKISWKIVYFLSYGLSTILIFCVLFFAYNYITRTISYTEEAMKLKRIVAPEAFDTKDFDKVIENKKKKEDSALDYDVAKIQNIFSEIRDNTDVSTSTKENIDTKQKDSLPKENPKIE